MFVDMYVVWISVSIGLFLVKSVGSRRSTIQLLCCSRCFETFEWDASVFMFLGNLPRAEIDGVSRNYLFMWAG